MNRISLVFSAVTWLILSATEGLADGKEKVLFEAKWTPELGDGWSWVRGEPNAWRVEKDVLSIRSEPGSLFGKEHTHKNLLLRKLPETKKGLIVEVYLENQPKHQWEHGGLLWYYDDDNFVSIWKEKTGKQVEMLMDRKKAGQHAFAHVKHEGEGVWLRLQIADQKATTFCRATDKDEWKKVGQFDLPVKGEPRVGMTCAGAPKEADSWARFRHFRIIEMAK